ncbi:DUF805 domain-containing protein [Afifella sp. IM 167]|uniref:DUF805 domain-containing protein n=1 Tax=Afifella sp. IM 167 TaxID=2033586 RepID=UPI001CD00E37|nr:DUF805 domain-containing protein [Afifella sp. IM 167]MBZ8133800.1 DUF805 domain-containing protein [Afifella sp. IM 167]
MLRRFLWLFFRFDGRIGREVYWLANFGLVALLAFLVHPSIDPQTSEVTLQGGSLGGLALLVGIVSSIAIGAKRLHDFNAPGAFAAVLLVPILSIFATIAFGLVRGTPGQNRFGEAADMPPR